MMMMKRTYLFLYCQNTWKQVYNIFTGKDNALKPDTVGCIKAAGWAMGGSTEMTPAEKDTMLKVQQVHYAPTPTLHFLWKALRMTFPEHYAAISTASSATQHKKECTGGSEAYHQNPNDTCHREYWVQILDVPHGYICFRDESSAINVGTWFHHHFDNGMIGLTGGNIEGQIKKVNLIYHCCCYI